MVSLIISMFDYLCWGVVNVWQKGVSNNKQEVSYPLMSWFSVLLRTVTPLQVR